MPIKLYLKNAIKVRIIIRSPKAGPPDVVDTQDKRVELLEQCNIECGSFRDNLSVLDRKYFEEHMAYLSTSDPEKINDFGKKIRSRD